MGCVAVSSSSFGEYRKTAEFKEWKDRLQAVHIDKSAMAQLYNMYLRVDSEKKCRIHHLHLSKNFAVDRTKFTERVWCVLNKDDLGELCFAQFVLTLYTFSTLTKDELVSFVFDMYDSEGRGVMSSTSVTDMLHELYLCKVTHDLISTIVNNEFKAVDQAQQGVTLDTFRGFVEAHHGIFNPVYQLQHTLRVKTLGTAFWEKTMRLRARKKSFSEDVKMTRSVSSERAAQSVKQRAVLASTHRKREVHSVRIASCSEMESVDDGANLTSFFLLETPFPSYKESSWNNDCREDFTLIDQA